MLLARVARAKFTARMVGLLTSCTMITARTRLGSSRASTGPTAVSRATLS